MASDEPAWRAWLSNLKLVMDIGKLVVWAGGGGFASLAALLLNQFRTGLVVGIPLVITAFAGGASLVTALLRKRELNRHRLNPGQTTVTLYGGQTLAGQVPFFL